MKRDNGQYWPSVIQNYDCESLYSVCLDIHEEEKEGGDMSVVVEGGQVYEGGVAMGR